MTTTNTIPNITIGRDYDERYKDADIHYEALGNLADFFGRSMLTHRHDRYYQIHYVKTGTVYVCLGEDQYKVKAPLFFITPPIIPHSFVTEELSDGHVLTVRQQFVWSILDEIPELKANYKSKPICVSIKQLPIDLQQEAVYLAELLDKLRDETYKNNIGRLAAQQSLVKLIFISLFRLVDEHQVEIAKPFHYQALNAFRQFNDLVERFYKEHKSLKDYASEMVITEAKLNDICRQITNTSPKQIILDRVMQEAKYLLLFAQCSIKDIGYQLGFEDPAYFTRFFSREAKMSPKEYRKMIINQSYAAYFIR